MPTQNKPKTKSRIFDTMAQAATVLGIPLEALKSAKVLGCSAFRGGRVHQDPLRDFVKGLRWTNGGWRVVFTGPEFTPTSEQRQTILKGVWD